MFRHLSRCLPRMCLLMGLLSLGGPLFSQTTVLVLERGTGLTIQRLVFSPLYPDQFLNMSLRAGFRASDMAGTANGWTHIFSQGAGMYQRQSVKQGGDFPAAAIATKRADRAWVQELGYHEDRWAVFFNADLPYTAQQTRTTPAPSPDSLAAAFQNGWALTSAGYGQGQWRLMLSRGSGRNAQRVLVQQGRFPEAEAQRLLNGGWRIREVAAGGNAWLVVLAQEPGAGKQRLKVTTEVERPWLQDQWRQGYAVVAAAADLPDLIKGNTIGNDAMWSALMQVDDPAFKSDYKDFIRHFPEELAGLVALRRLISPMLMDGRYEEAVAMLKEYRGQLPAFQEQIDATIDILTKPANDARVSNLGGKVNSAAPEYEAVPTADGQRLYFTGNGRPGGVGGIGQARTEDVFYSDLVDGQWTEARVIPPPLNSADHNESANGISAGGNVMFLFGSSRTEGLGRGDNFSSRRSKQGWGPPEPFPPPYNTPFFDSEAIPSPDGRAIFFVSDRPGGIGPTAFKGSVYAGDVLGNSDIYVIPIGPDGQWGKPVNLGPTINTAFPERSPFLHPDGRTLYFSSSGHNSLGMLDVFVSKRTGPGWTDWSPPRNLGKEINGPGKDWGYRVSTDGGEAYFAKQTARRSQDIFTIELPKEFRPEPVAKLRGRITGPAGNPLEASVRWRNPRTNELLGQVSTNPEDGTYFLVLPLNKDYVVEADAPGHAPRQEELALRDATESTDQHLDFELPRASPEPAEPDDAPPPLTGLPPESRAQPVGEPDAASAEPEKPVASSSSDSSGPATSEASEKPGPATSAPEAQVYFDTDQAAIQPAFHGRLMEVVHYLEAHPGARVRVTGHTDARASQAYNDALSKRRAESVKRFLVQQGVGPERIELRWQGETQPAAGNSTPKGRSRNRRAAVTILPS